MIVKVYDIQIHHVAHGGFKGIEIEVASGAHKLKVDCLAEIVFTIGHKIDPSPRRADQLLMVSIVHHAQPPIVAEILFKFKAELLLDPWEFLRLIPEQGSDGPRVYKPLRRGKRDWKLICKMPVRQPRLLQGPARQSGR